MLQTKIEGEYYFRRTEMAAGFNFSADGKFQFFFSYGAVDRTASGTFTTEGNIIQLKAGKEAGKDFSITNQYKQGKGYTLTFDHPNKYLPDHILCIFSVNGKEQQALTNNKGEVHVDLEHCDLIYAQHLLYPDIATLIKDAANENNHFTLDLKPALEQLSFKGIDLTIEPDKTLSWLPNYFLDMAGVKFVKK